MSAEDREEVAGRENAALPSDVIRLTRVVAPGGDDAAEGGVQNQIVRNAGVLISYDIDYGRRHRLTQYLANDDGLGRSKQLCNRVLREGLYLAKKSPNESAASAGASFLRSKQESAKSNSKLGMNKKNGKKNQVREVFLRDMELRPVLAAVPEVYRLQVQNHDTFVARKKEMRQWIIDYLRNWKDPVLVQAQERRISEAMQ